MVDDGTCLRGYMDRLKSLGIDRVGGFFLSLALLVHSWYFTAPFVIPKLVILSIGLLVMALMVAWGAPVNRGRSMLADGSLLLAACVLSAVYANDVWLAIVGNHNSYSLGIMGLLLALGYHMAGSSGRSVGLIPLAGALMGVHAFGQWAGFDDAVSSTISGHRAIGTIGSPVFLGMALVVILPLALQASMVYGLAVALGLFATKSRGAWVAAVVGLLAWGLSSRRRGYLWGAVAACILVGLSFPIMSRTKRSDIERMGVWTAAVKTIDQNPVLGVGPDGFSNAYRLHRGSDWGKDVAEDAHNDVLQALATTGPVGLLAYSLLAINAFKLTFGAGLASLWALFANLKFNPIALEILVLAAFICGACMPGIPENRPLPRHSRALVLLLAMAITGLSARIALADHFAWRGDFLSMIKASEINPYEMNYKAGLFNRGIEQFNKSRDSELKTAIFNALEKAAEESLLLRPGSPMSWQIAGKMEQVRLKIFGVGEPEKYLSRAREMDPYLGRTR